jgi:amino acid adenylation domain-containing protein
MTLCLEEWNDTKAEFPSDKCIHELFEEQVKRMPGAVAVVHEKREISYGELNARANQLAHYLRKLEVKPDGRVAICMVRGIEMIVGLLAVLKAGGAYVPLDPAYPAERLSAMLGDIAPTVLLTQGRLQVIFTGVNENLTVIDLATKVSQWANQPDTNPDRASVGLTPEHLAYVIYTSGSTGRPKGVMIEHRGVCNQITALRIKWRLCAEDRILQFVSFAFDVSVEEIFGALLSGATLVLRTDAWLAGAQEFWTLCEKWGVSVVDLPMRFWQQISMDRTTKIPSCIRLLATGGEIVEQKALTAWFKREGHRPKLFNAYGPTETTVNATMHEPTPDDSNWQSIGRPIANTRIYILDGQGEPVPIGVAGEIHIGGVGVARGYLNQPDLTAKCFVAERFSGEAQARMYKTGDLGRWLPDGTIEFLGRNDCQVKVRGYRIELGEIEMRLREHRSVREAVVIAREDSPGDKRLVAYYTGADAEKQGEAAVGAKELRSYLTGKLPDYMVPGAYVRLKVLPLTSSGKLDRKVLPAPEAGAYVVRGHLNQPDLARGKGAVAQKGPWLPLHFQLIELWEQLLRIDSIGIEDNFFDLGGDSLLAAAMLSGIDELCGRQFPLTLLFQRPTIEALAEEVLSQDVNPTREAIIPLNLDGSKQPLFFLHGDVLGGGFYCRKLAQQLGAEQPLYVLPHVDLDRYTEIPDVQSQASIHLDVVRAVKPSGPYLLGGFCDAGIIAWEMARQLEAQGQKVSLLVLIDAIPPAWYFRLLRRLTDRFGSHRRFDKKARLQWFNRWARKIEVFRRLTQLPVSEQIDCVRRRGQARSNLVASAPSDSPPARQSRQTRNTEASIWWAISGYSVPQLSVPLTCLVSESFRREHRDGCCGWRAIAEHIVVETLPGAHLASITKHADVVAEKLTRHLNSVLDTEDLSTNGGTSSFPAAK